MIVTINWSSSSSSQWCDDTHNTMKTNYNKFKYVKKGRDGHYDMSDREFDLNKSNLKKTIVLRPMQFVISLVLGQLCVCTWVLFEAVDDLIMAPLMMFLWPFFLQLQWSAHLHLPSDVCVCVPCNDLSFLLSSTASTVSNN